ncbi:Protein insensitive [Eumeta japonica]|uniref:Protein insensitive n=1 Tax=Eumeta variegata TaxID=151549 RepID=A0A4C1UXR7_EUMVA|nr:Protein insensitive [Eumeta japonica]
MSQPKWLMVEWEEVNANRSTYSVISTKSLHYPCPDLHTGKLVTIATRGGTLRRAKVVMVSEDRRFLEQQLATMEEHRRLYANEIDVPVKSSLPLTLAAKKVEFVSRNFSKHIADQRYGKPVDPYKWRHSEDSSNISDEETEVLLKKTELDLQVKPAKFMKTSFKSCTKRKINDIWSHQVPTTSRLSEDLSRMSTPDIKYEIHNFTARESSNTSSSQWNSASSPLPSTVSPAPVMMYDQQSQTDPVNFDDDNLRAMIPKVGEDMNLIIRIIEVLENKVNFVETAIDKFSVKPNIRRNEIDIHDGSENSELETDAVDEPNNQSSRRGGRDIPKTSQWIMHKDSSNDTSHDSGEETNGSDMIPIGSGKTFVPRHILEQIDWNSYTMATRKLLMALFPRRTLATHSLTGKSSPAFMNKPAKLCLDPQKVSDIVMTVTNNCRIKESLVRGAITTKCADENKMYRMRLLKKERRHKKSSTSTDGVNSNQENVPPTGNPESRHNSDNNIKKV